MSDLEFNKSLLEILAGVWISAVWFEKPNVTSIFMPSVQSVKFAHFAKHRCPIIISMPGVATSGQTEMRKSDLVFFCLFLFTPVRCNPSHFGHLAPVLAFSHPPLLCRHFNTDFFQHFFLPNSPPLLTSTQLEVDAKMRNGFFMFSKTYQMSVWDIFVCNIHTLSELSNIL